VRRLVKSLIGAARQGMDEPNNHYFAKEEFMRTEKVIVEEYNPAWRQEFEKIRISLEASLDGLALAIEHVGSTSVEGLAAKPIIDIDVVIEGMDFFGKVRQCLEPLGYWHEGDLGIAGREAFAYSGKPEWMVHHLYVCPKDSEELHRHLTFRDWLRTHPEDRERYAAIKRLAAREFPADIDAYLEKKGPVIEDIYRKCGLLR